MDVTEQVASRGPSEREDVMTGSDPNTVCPEWLAADAWFIGGACAMAAVAGGAR